MPQNNIVIGVEGLVGAGKTSICRRLLDYIPNSVLLNGGNLYRTIVYVLLQQEMDLQSLARKIRNVDIKAIMDKLNIQIKVEDRETKFYYNNKLIQEEEIQSVKSSLAVSSIGGVADNTQLFEFAKNLIDQLKKEHNVIVSGRSIMKIYPKIDYHFFITATIEERVKRKSKQYEDKIDIKELQEQINKRDMLQKKAGFYELSANTIEVDVTECKNIEESTKKVLDYIGTFELVNV